MAPPPSNLSLFIGHFHVLLVHLPIGFLILLASLELIGSIKRFSSVRAARSPVLVLTAVAAICTIVCGLLLSTAGGYDASLLWFHKWLGIGVGVGTLAALVAWFKNKLPVYYGVLAVTLVMLTLASHFGGSLTHGSNYLTEYAPAFVRDLIPGGTPTQSAQLAMARVPPDPRNALIFSNIVQPILAADCVSCHSQNRSSGGLSLETIDSLIKGGKDGSVLVPGNSKDSLIVQRISLPPDDARHMPPDGKPQPTDDQIALVLWWIDSGASANQKVADARIPPSLAPVLNALLGTSPSSNASAVAEAVPVPSLDQLAAPIGHITSTSGVLILPVSADAPWLSCNASLSHSFGDHELAALAPLAQNVVELNLARTKVTDAALSAISGMIHLRKLRLDHTAVTDAGLQSIRNLPELEYLNLCGTAVTDAGLKSLSGLPKLHSLYLWQTKVDPDAARAFAASRSDPVELRRLRAQIDALQDQLAQQQVNVVEGLSNTTQPTTVAADSTVAPVTGKTAAP